jgi:hypothetical protein
MIIKLKKTKKIWEKIALICLDILIRVNRRRWDEAFNSLEKIREFIK